MLEFLKQQSEESFDGVIQLHERSRKILRCLLSWVRQIYDTQVFLDLYMLRNENTSYIPNFVL